MPDQLVVRCPSCGRELRADDENGLVDDLQRHLVEEHDLEVPAERVGENVVAQLKDFDGYNARPISGA
jgi:predicted small metal-binding protein